MAGSVCEVTIIGRVGKDPEIRNLANGGKVANLSVATSEKWKGKDGEWVEKTEWHRVVSFSDNITSVIERFVKKGSQIHLRGTLQTRKWTDQSGAEKYSTEVVIPKFDGKLTLMDSKRDDAEPSGRPGGYPPESGAAPRQPAGGGADIGEDIPFAACWQ